ncbi:hypothetical protein EV209_0963 [Cuneatibacter caecimuris]|uniref:Uncharacterized protein n=1 Tax=Cuneatibacter caecimuris TaxID=1796618 RepID=A0A4Q7PPI4_9FIRM|nr:hypothetical protein EV209_0963 [Cuneatibacter caecimuris]
MIGVLMKQGSENSGLFIQTDGNMEGIFNTDKREPL